jgi:hypothetical protein
MSGQNQNITKTPNLDTAQCRVGGRGGDVSKGSAPFLTLVKTSHFHVGVGHRHHRISICLVILGISGIVLLHGQQFRVEGTLTTKRLLPSKRMERELSSKFVLTVASNGWEIRMLPDKKKAGDYQILTFDGDHLFIFNSIESSIATIAPAVNNSDAHKRGDSRHNLADCCVVKVEVPHFWPSEGAGLVWLTYASARYFTHATNNVLDVPWEYDGERPFMVSTRIVRNGAWRLMQDEPQLPKEVVYYFTGSEFTNAVYLAGQVTNFAGFVLPVESVLEVFASVPDTISGIRQPRHYSTVTLNADRFIKHSEEVESPPKVPVYSIVTDHRFGDAVGPVSYSVSNRFLTIEEAKRAGGSYSVLRTREMSAATQPHIRIITIGILMLTSVAIFVLLHRKKARKEQ